MRAFERVCATEFGVPNATERLNFSGRTDASILREFFLTNGIQPRQEAFDRFFDRYVFWLDRFLHELSGEVCPGVRRFILDLEQLEQPPLLGLLTGNIRLGAEIKLRHYCLWDFFKMGAFADEHESRNALADIARTKGSRMLDRELDGSEVLVIGDTPLDIECARAIGARVLAVATGGISHEKLQRFAPDFLVEDLRAISAAEACAEHQRP